MGSDAERIATLERAMIALEERLDDQDADLHAIRDDVREIRDVITKYQGFAGGVIATFTILGGVLGAASVFLWHKLTS
jgi:hypothetical protein